MRTFVVTALLLPLVVAAAPGDPASAAASRPGTFVYIHERGTAANQIHAFRVTKEHQLEAVPGSPFAVPGAGTSCGGECQTMAWSKKRRMLYASSVEGVSALLIAADGSLTPTASTPAGPGSGNFSGTAARDVGRRTFVYASEYDHDRVRAFESKADGSLVEIADSPFAVGFEPDGLAVAGDRLFVCNEGDNTISSFALKKDGTATSAGAATPNGTGYSYNVNPDPKGKFVYVGGCGGANVAAFRVGKHAELTAVPGTPFATTTVDFPCAGVAVSSKLVVVPQSRTVGAAQTYARRKDGSIVAKGPVNTEGVIGCFASAFDAAGRILAIASNSELALYSVSSKTGAVTRLSNATFGGVQSNQVLFVTR
jgi:6-phosphogluconolactonase (cycloisomerase 2 family)